MQNQLSLIRLGPELNLLLGSLGPNRFRYWSMAQDHLPKVPPANAVLWGIRFQNILGSGRRHKIQSLGRVLKSNNSA